MAAVGLSSAIEARTASIASGVAESTLLMITTSAIRMFVSPGW